MNIRTALAQGTKVLEDARIEAPRLTAEVLLACAVERDRSWLYAHSDEELTELGWIHFGHYLYQRSSGVPTQYITKRQEFYGREFRVTPDVLIPRPETEHLIETVLRLTPSAQRILDIGCGSGAIAITLALETKSAVFASDISERAAKVARANAASLSASVQFAVGDLGTAFAARSFDLIVSNPPYVPSEHIETLQREVRGFEPHIALEGGPRGLLLYSRLVRETPALLQHGGWLMMELGFTAAEPVRAMFDSRWTDLELVPDLAGIPRVIAARYTP